MESAGMTWKETAMELTKEFMAWGCRFSRKKLPEIAMGYECTPLFFWNWMDEPEAEKTENGFLVFSIRPAETTRLRLEAIG